MPAKDNRIRILAVGQLPVEAGGNYTTGMGKVMLELSGQSYPGADYATLALNAADRKVSGNRHIGYVLPVGRLIAEVLLHPVRLVREIADYRRYLDYSPWRALFYRLNIDRAIARTSATCVHLHSIDHVLPFSHANQAGTVSSVLTCHGIFGVGDSGRRRDMYVESMRRVDEVTGLTEEIDRRFAQFGVDADRRHIIPNGVDTDKYHYDPQTRATVREELGISDKRTVFLTVGSLQQRKGQYDFMRLLKESGLDFEYWLLGDGPDRQKIREWADANGIGDRIRMTGYTAGQDLYRYYSAADIYAHVSYAEGQALSEIEARATGLRILVNSDVAHTLPAQEAGSPYCRVIEMQRGGIWNEELLEWIRIPQTDRVTDGTLDWQNIADMYHDIYKRIAL